MPSGPFFSIPTRQPIAANRYAIFLLPAALLPVAIAVQYLASQRRHIRTLTLASLVVALAVNWGWGRPSSFAPDSIRRVSPHWLYKISEVKAMVQIFGTRPDAPLITGLATKLASDLETQLRPSWALFLNPQENFRPHVRIPGHCDWFLTVSRLEPCVRGLSPDVTLAWILASDIDSEGEPQMPLATPRTDPIGALKTHRCLVVKEAHAFRYNVLALVDVEASRECLTIHP